MSFFRGFYGRTPHSDTVRTNSYVADVKDVEEYIEEDGFVVYTERTSRCATVSQPSTNFAISYIKLYKFNLNKLSLI